VTSVAVIGAGISGLAAAYYLSRKFDVHLFEKDTRLGGHTNTVMVESSQGPLAVDTGFIVHNDKTYPNFCRLRAELGVATAPSDMSFAVYSPETNFEYSSRGASGFFADRMNAIRPRHWFLLREIMRFNREAPRLLATDDDIALGEFVEEGRYSAAFLERYLYPMASAVWSMSPDAATRFPARTLVQFFANHGMLGIDTHPRWKVIRGGSCRYLDPITEPIHGKIDISAGIQSVTRNESRVTIRFAERPERHFDHVVFACHGDQVLPLLADPTDTERDVLSNFTTTRNETVLHTDSSLLPRRRNARASWNYHIGSRGRVTVTYHMNRLQGFDLPEDYCVTLNADGRIDPSKVIRRIVYHHPLYTREAIRAQARWAEISGAHRTHYCGAYWHYGFHEDGVNSALRVARALGVAA
jgi:predicted NAD/FAD-binding protein